MSLEAARNLSVLELLQVLNENLDLEFARVREICLSPAIPAAPLQTEVSTQYISRNAVARSDVQIFRSKAWKLERTMF